MMQAQPYGGSDNTERPQFPLPEELAAFEAQLAGRTKVPVQRLSEYLEYDESDVQQKTLSVARILKRFAEAVVSAMEDPASADDFLRELDLKAISRDHDWRTIFNTLRDESEGFEGHKRAALTKYLQYLSFRKRLLEFIYARKSGLEVTDAFTEIQIYATPANEDLRTLDPQTRARVALEEESGEFRRLPLGETIELILPRGRKVYIRLASRMMRLVGAENPCLVDPKGVMYFLREGRNMVGRHPESDVVVDPEYSDVSRAHMIVEWDGGIVVSITDLSSQGTYVKALNVQGTGAAA